MAVVLFSAGIDSLVHLMWAKDLFQRDVQTLYVNFGHRYADREMAAAHRICDFLEVPLRLIDVNVGFAEHDDGFIPLRNLMLLELASYIADDIVFGMLYHEGPPDKRPRFISGMQRLMNEQYRDHKYFAEDRRIKIHTPFGEQTKTEMLRWFLRNFPHLRCLVRETIGCFDPAGGCGRCMACFNRWVALTNCGIHERFDYPPAQWAAEQLIAGRKNRQSLLGLGALLYKRRWLVDVYRALCEIMPSPIQTAWRLQRTKDIAAYTEGLFAPVRCSPFQ